MVAHSLLHIPGAARDPTPTLAHGAEGPAQQEGGCSCRGVRKPWPCGPPDWARARVPSRGPVTAAIMKPMPAPPETNEGLFSKCWECFPRFYPGLGAGYAPLERHWEAWAGHHLPGETPG